ncbi:MAG: glutathione S-transferase family protein [Myxococcota bacterium]
MIVYANRESGHSYKVVATLVLAGAPHEIRTVDLDVPRQDRRADFLAVSPYGEVPVLVDGETVLAQSNAILVYLARKLGVFGGESEARLALVTQWLFWEANRVGISVPNLRHLKRSGGAAPAVFDWLRARAVADLGRLDRELADRRFVLGETPTVVDVACSAYLWFPADQAELELAPWPNVERWLDAIRALPGWRHPYDAIPGHVVGGHPG